MIVRRPGLSRSRRRASRCPVNPCPRPPEARSSVSPGWVSDPSGMAGGCRADARRAGSARRGVWDRAAWQDRQRGSRCLGEGRAHARTTTSRRPGLCGTEGQREQGARCAVPGPLRRALGDEPASDGGGHGFYDVARRSESSALEYPAFFDVARGLRIECALIPDLFSILSKSQSSLRPRPLGRI